jgi:hypothetical protein
MTRKDLKKLLVQLERIHKNLENIIVEIQHALEATETSKVKTHFGSHSLAGSTTTKNFELLRKQWAELEAKVESSPDPDSVIRDFVENNSKQSLREFIVANALPINPKDSKEAILKQLIQLLRITKIIRGI